MYAVKVNKGKGRNFTVQAGAGFKKQKILGKLCMISCPFCHWTTIPVQSRLSGLLCLPVSDSTWTSRTLSMAC